MQDYYIKANNKEELDLLLAQCGYMIEGEYITASENHALFVIGEIWKPSGIFNQVTNSEGNVISVEEKIKKEGYHANLRLIDVELPEILIPFVINPQNPMYGWL